MKPISRRAIPGKSDPWRYRDPLAGRNNLADAHRAAGCTAAQARDVLWVPSSVELWDLAVNHRPCSDERFGQWVGHQLVAALVLQ